MLKKANLDFTYSNRAFTLIEMMVVVGIFFIITGVVLVNVPDFREKTSVDLVAQDIAVTIRSAQVFGVGTKALDGDVVPYGVYLSSSPSRNNKFVLFADQNSGGNSVNWQYDMLENCPTSSECQSLYSLNGFRVDSIWVYQKNQPRQEVEEINILFSRPRPNPIVCFSDQNCPILDVDKIEVIVKSSRENKQKMVVVHANGQIEVRDVDN